MTNGTQIIVLADFNAANIEFIIEEILATGFNLSLAIHDVIDSILKKKNEPVLIFDKLFNNSFKLYINNQIKNIAIFITNYDQIWKRKFFYGEQVDNIKACRFLLMISKQYPIVSLNVYSLNDIILENQEPNVISMALFKPVINNEFFVLVEAIELSEELDKHNCCLNFNGLDYTEEAKVRIIEKLLVKKGSLSFINCNDHKLQIAIDGQRIILTLQQPFKLNKANYVDTSFYLNIALGISDIFGLEELAVNF